MEVKESFKVVKVYKTILTALPVLVKSAGIKDAPSGVREFINLSFKSMIDYSSDTTSSEDGTANKDYFLQVGYLLDVDPKVSNLSDMPERLRTEVDLRLDEDSRKGLSDTLNMLNDWDSAFKGEFKVSTIDEQAISRITIGSCLCQFQSFKGLGEFAVILPPEVKLPAGFYMTFTFVRVGFISKILGRYVKMKVTFRVRGSNNGDTLLTAVISLLNDYDLSLDKIHFGTKENRCVNIDEVLSDLDELQDKERAIIGRSSEACCKLRACKDFGEFFAIYNEVRKRGINLDKDDIIR